MALGQTNKELRVTWGGFTLLFAIAACISFFKGTHTWFVWLPLSVFFLFFATVAPRRLMPVYRVWVKFATVMAFVNTRLLLGAIYYGMISPMAMWFRLRGKDILDQRIDKDAATYWHVRDPSSSERDFTAQF
jgi:hypothetical protein